MSPAVRRLVELLARAEDDLGEWERIYRNDRQTTQLRLEIAGFIAANSARETGTP